MDVTRAERYSAQALIELIDKLGFKQHSYRIFTTTGAIWDFIVRVKRKQVENKSSAIN